MRMVLIRSRETVIGRNAMFGCRCLASVVVLRSPLVHSGDYVPGNAGMLACGKFPGKFRNGLYSACCSW